MTRIFKFRLVAFAFAILALATMIGWAAYTSWREAGKLQDSFNTGNLRSFEIADHIQTSILTLNNTMIRFELQNEQSALQEFRISSAALNDWIDQQKPTLRSPREKDLLNNIDQTYDVYLDAATNGVTHASPDNASKVAHLERIYRASLTLLELGYQLADAHRLVLQDYLVASQKSVLLLQRLIFGSLFLLIASLAWMLVTVFQEMIAPLQRKLVESTAIIERQEKLASLGVLAAGVAHEIRNPLTAIKARLFTQRKALAKDSPEYDDSIVISNEINRLEQIVKDVLQFARPSEPKLVPMTANAVLRQVCDLMQPQFIKESIGIEIGAVSTSHFQGDPEQIKQVLINLIQNAAESIEHDGTIVLRARDGTARLSGHSKSVVILEVQDNGKGIAPDVQKRLFDPFFSTKATGTGLGLSISARILEKHGGALEFQTQVDYGTTFGIILPAA